MKNKNKKEKENNIINNSSLRKYATTKRLKFILKNHIESETIPSVKAAWIEYFFELKKLKNEIIE